MLGGNGGRFTAQTKMPRSLVSAPTKKNAVTHNKKLTHSFKSAWNQGIFIISIHICAALLWPVFHCAAARAPTV
jgi:hypothetical protein